MRNQSIIKRIKGKVLGILEKYCKHYHLYIKYYNDNFVVDNTIFFETFNGMLFQGDAFYILRYLVNNEKYSSFKIFIAAVNPDREFALLKNVV